MLKHLLKTTEDSSVSIKFSPSAIDSTTYKNQSFRLGISTQITDTDLDGNKDDVLLGIWFKGELYQNEYILKEIKNMPNYFADYDTTVHFISEEELKFSKIIRDADKVDIFHVLVTEELEDIYGCSDFSEDLITKEIFEEFCNNKRIDYKNRKTTADIWVSHMAYIYDFNFDYCLRKIKYEGYIKLQDSQVEKFKKLESKKLSENMEYSKLNGLSLEARQKLDKIKPLSIGQASRISGVSPADVSVLLIYLEQQKRK